MNLLLDCPRSTIQNTHSTRLMTVMADVTVKTPESLYETTSCVYRYSTSLQFDVYSYYDTKQEDMRRQVLELKKCGFISPKTIQKEKTDVSIKPEITGHLGSWKQVARTTLT